MRVRPQCEIVGAGGGHEHRFRTSVEPVVGRARPPSVEGLAILPVGKICRAIRRISVVFLMIYLTARCKSCTSVATQ